MKYYYENETDTILSIDDIKRSYELFGKDYDSFEYYLSCCQWYNNGTLTPIEIKLSSIRRRLAEIEKSADLYGYEFFQDEINNLTAQANEFSKYVTK